MDRLKGHVCMQVASGVFIPSDTHNQHVDRAVNLNTNLH